MKIAATLFLTGCLALLAASIEIHQAIDDNTNVVQKLNACQQVSMKQILAGLK
jgi:hypothetical protein